MPTIALLDIGHSRVKLASATTLASFDVERVSEWDTHSVDWKEIATWVKAHVVADELRCCCVVHSWMEEASNIDLERLFAMPVRMLGVGTATAYDPTQLGVDRYLLSQGALAYCHETALVVSAGTTITLDVVTNLDERGELGSKNVSATNSKSDSKAGPQNDRVKDNPLIHQGGWILPGLSVLKQGYEQITPHFPQLRYPDSVSIVQGIQIPTQTHDAISHGFALSLTSLISRLLEEYEIADVYFTGGDGATLRDLWESYAENPHDTHVEVVPDLLFYGMMKSSE